MKKKSILTLISILLFLIILLAVFTSKLSPLALGPLDNLAAALFQRGSGIIIYDGESAPLLTALDKSCLSYAEEVSPGRGGSGKALKLTPDQWHSAGYSVNCGGQERLNFSIYSYLEFYIKGTPQTGGSHDFNIVSYYGTSNTVNLMSYVEGGQIDDTWRLVSIPLTALKTATYSLDTVDTLYFGTDSSNRVFYIDDLAVRYTKTITAAPAAAPAPAVVQEPAVINLYNGDTFPLLYTDRSCVSYATEVAGAGKDGSKGLKLTPDAYHAPNFKVYCGGRARQNFSNYSAIEFYFKADSSTSNDPEFNVVSYFGESNRVSIRKYIEGGVIDTNWRLVSIPISDLKTGSFSLNTVDDIYFGTDSQSRPLYIDNLLVTKNRSVVNTTVIKATTAPTPTSTPIPTPTRTPVKIPVATVVPVKAPVAAPAPVTPVVKNAVPVKIENLMDAKVKDVTKDDLTDVKPTASQTSDEEFYDFDEIDLANHFGQWLYAENKDYVSLNFTQKYDTNKIKELSAYTITSSDDPAFATAKNPVVIGYRWRTLYAPTIRKTDLKIAYRIFLKLPSSLKNGKTYTVTANNIGITTKPFTFTFDDSTLNQNIKVNQVGYLPNSHKIGYIGQYMGTAGPMPFAISSFEIKDSKTGSVVFSGVPKARAVDVNNTGQNVYDLDFSSFTTPGIYVIHVPGVGTSFPFRIGGDVYNEVFSVAMRGAYQQRSGTSLTSNFTRFTHGPSHMDDAYVMSSNPVPDWFRQRFDSEGDTTRKDDNGKRLYYPTTLGGQKISTVKGHYDAGDYGKYVINGSLFVGNILSAFDAFPSKLMKDDISIPEGGNGIPDLIDETKWELDWLENMQDPVDGGVFCIVKPDGAVEYYENRLMDDPSPAHRLLYAKDTTCTGAYAAALAKAAQSPLIVKNYPDAAKRYLDKAKKAWDFLSKNPGYLGWHHYGVKDEFDADKSMDERVWAAFELYGATGDKQYKDFFMAHHKPEYERWGWNTLFEASGQANYACAFMTRDIDKSMKDRCAKEIIKAADSHVVDSNDRAYRLSMSDAPLNYRDFTYFFPQERIIQLLIANTISPDPSYTEAALYNWDYVLGANPTGYSFITGIGSKRFREAVSTQGVMDNIKAPIPGLPIGMGNNFGYLEVYGSNLAQMYPPNNGGSPASTVSYPLLEQVYDGWNIGVEYTIPEISENMVSAAYFATTGDGKNTPPSSISISADKVSGAIPLAVHFQASGTDSDGKVVRYFWDFDDETYSIQQNPVHTFDDPYKLYKVVLTVTDNDGAEKYKEIDVRTSPAVFTSSSDNYAKDANTLALFHMDASPLADDSLHGYVIKTSGNTAISNENVLWMKQGSGRSLAFNSVNDTAVVELPRKAVFPTDGSTLVVEGKIYADSFLSLNTKSSDIFTLTQGDSKLFGLYDAIYVDGTHISVADGYDKQKILITNKDFAALQKQGKMALGTWYNFKLVVSGGQASVYVNNEKISDSAIAPSFAGSDEPIVLKMGGFKGYIDEVRISNVVR